MPPIRVLFACLVLSVGCVKTLPTEPPQQVSPLKMSAGEWRAVDNVVVVTDASGTMYMEETFPEAKSLTQSFVAAMPSANERAKNPNRYEVGSIGFGGEDRIVQPLSRFDRNALAAKAQSLEIMGSIDGTGGTTPYHQVFAEVQGALQGKRGSAAVVIFSDGVPDDSKAGLAGARQLVESYPDTICIHGVQTGADPEGTEFLRTVSKLTPCGSLRSASTLQNSSALMAFTRGVFTGKSPLPAVAAAPDPCRQQVAVGGIGFEFASDRITPDGEVVLAEFAERLVGCPKVRVQLHGHTDSTGPESYNQNLSERRARSAKDFLVGQGVAAERLEYEGFGESRPAVSNDTREGRKRNRRVELRPQQ